MKRILTLFLTLALPTCSFGASSSATFVPVSVVNGLPFGGNSAPELAVAANGNAFAAWLNFPNNIQTAFFNAGINSPTGQWTFLGTLAQGSVPQISIDQTGNAFIIWVGASTAFSTPIFVSRFDATAMSFSTPLQLSNVGTFNSTPRIAVNGIGVAVAVWIQVSPFQVLSSSFSPPPGTGWSAATSIFSNVFPATYALDNFNRGLALFNSFSGAAQGSIQSLRIFAP